jgi:hypothetical protein
VAEAIHRHGGDYWEKWNASLRDLFVSRQEADGSWPATGDAYGSSGGRLMVSSLTILTLEIYYRDDLALASVVARSRKAVEMENTWSDLAADDPIRARRGLWALVNSSKQSVPLIAESLKAHPRTAVDDRQVARLIADLDDDKFEVREMASTELAKLGNAAAPALRTALKAPGSAESHRRLEALVAKLEKGRDTPEHRRALRAIEVLEHVGTPEARQVLTRLAKESSDADLERAARAALARLTESK